MSLRRLGAIASALGVAACSSLFDAEAPELRGKVVLSRTAGNASQAVVGPYVSVIDSVTLSITASGGTPQLIGRHLAPYDTAVTIPLRVAAGSATFSVRVLSNNDTLLYGGQVSRMIDRDGFAVTVPLAAVKPVLVVNPDTIKTSVNGPVTGQRITKVAVRNSGRDTLVWRLKPIDDTAFARCNAQSQIVLPCRASPLSGRVAANGLDTLTFFLATSAFRDTARRVFSFVLTSPEGDVTVRWRYP